MTALVTEIAKLSLADRIKLVQAILQTIAAETESSGAFEPSPAQSALIEKRSLEIATGIVQTVSWDSIEAKIAKRYGLQN